MASAAACILQHQSLNSLYVQTLVMLGLFSALNSFINRCVPVKHIPVISDDGFYIARNLAMLFMLKQFWLLLGEMFSAGFLGWNYNTAIQLHHCADGSGLHKLPKQLPPLSLPESTFVWLMDRSPLQALGRILSLGRDSLECLGCIPKSTRKIWEIIFNFKSSLPAFFSFPFPVISFQFVQGKNKK